MDLDKIDVNNYVYVAVSDYILNEVFDDSHDDVGNDVYYELI